MKKNKISLEGRFDVRNYNANLPREQWALKGESDTIRFTSVSDTPLNIEGEEFAKELTKDDGSKKYLYAFKIGSLTKFYDEFARLISKPSNEELDNGRYMASIVYIVKPKDPKQPTKACGMWVDAIMIKKVDENPFEGQPLTNGEESESDTEDVSLQF
jgi:hypothetical protein